MQRMHNDNQLGRTMDMTNENRTTYMDAIGAVPAVLIFCILISVLGIAGCIGVTVCWVYEKFLEKWVNKLRESK